MYSSSMMLANRLLTGIVVFALAMMVTAIDARSVDGVLEGLLRPIIVDRSPRAIFARQGAIPSVPPQCKTLCDPVNSVLSTGTCPRQQCCTTGFTKGYFDCFQCVSEAIGLTDYTAAQSIVDSIITTCATFGISLPVLTFPGQNPSRTLATLTPSSTQNTSPPTSRTTISNTDSITTQSITPKIPQSTVTALPTPTTPAPSSPPSNTPGAGVALRATRKDVLGGAIGALFAAKVLQLVL